jgi:putative DNA primase/helicase
MEYKYYKAAMDLIENESIITTEDSDEIFYWDEHEKIYISYETKLKALIQEKFENDATTHKVNEIMNVIRRTTYNKREIFTENLNLIPLQNKIYDFQSNQLIPYTPEHKFLKKHPITLTEIPSDYSNEISEWINTVVETQQDEIMLKEIIGYCFYRALPFQNFFLLVGSGANGKSVYLNILQKMLGHQNISGASLQHLADSNNRFVLAQLYLKNANIFGDLSAKAMKDVGTLKQLTGNDIITSDRKFKGELSFRNYAKIIASCNAIPETSEYSDAFFRRPIIINFPYSFVGKEDRTLFERITTEENLNLFFLDCMNSFKMALEENSLIKNDSIQEKKKTYLHYSNSARAFVEDKLEYAPESELMTHDIYEKYSVFCDSNKLIKKDERQFFVDVYRGFSNRVYKKRKEVSGTRYYVICGLDWK